MIKYENRYGDVYTFKQKENGNIQWKGDFKYSRIGMPNNYTLAFRAYQKDGGQLKLKDFVEAVHGESEVNENYSTLVVSETDKIDMVDPSGGPFITEGSDMKRFGLKGKVKQFLSIKGGYEIVIE
jgi:hypothetical protein